MAEICEGGIYSRPEDKKLIMESETNLERDLRVYLAFFDLTIEDLKDKKVLDVGSGAGVFAKEARDNEVDIVALDPLYSLREGRDVLYDMQDKLEKRKTRKFFQRLFNISRENNINAVAGFGEVLPFKDEKFDIILNLFSAFHYCRTPEILRKNFEEQLRVLSSGGKLLITPIWETYNIKKKREEFKLRVDPEFVKEEAEVLEEFDKIVEELTESDKFKVRFYQGRLGELVFDRPLGSPFREVVLEIIKN